MKIVRRATFNAAHRLYRKDWSHEKNDEVFGLCNNVNYHGHNYVLEVGIEGSIDPERQQNRCPIRECGSPENK